MKIEITCDCGEKVEVDASEIYVRDSTPCSCGCCHGESYEVEFGSCVKCKADLSVCL
jgi:hypothetical protein